MLRVVGADHQGDAIHGVRRQIGDLDPVNLHRPLVARIRRVKGAAALREGVELLRLDLQIVELRLSQLQEMVIGLKMGERAEASPDPPADEHQADSDDDGREGRFDEEKRLPTAPHVDVEISRKEMSTWRDTTFSIAKMGVFVERFTGH